MIDNIFIPYTLCFCIHNEDVLMMYRKHEPNKYLWNGIGGKIEPSETPEASIIREAREETGLNLYTAKQLYYAGIVTWKNHTHRRNEGMYVFLADLPADFIYVVESENREGFFGWKPVEWVCDKNNKEVVENIPYFLPHMLTSVAPEHYHFVYKENCVEKLIIKPLKKQFSKSTITNTRPDSNLQLL
jgi:8-oxo-dGTP diphosphatase